MNYFIDVELFERVIAQSNSEWRYAPVISKEIDRVTNKFRECFSDESSVIPIPDDKNNATLQYLEIRTKEFFLFHIQTFYSSYMSLNELDVFKSKCIDGFESDFNDKHFKDEALMYDNCSNKSLTDSQIYTRLKSDFYINNPHLLNLHSADKHDIIEVAGIIMLSEFKKYYSQKSELLQDDESVSIKGFKTTLELEQQKELYTALKNGNFIGCSESDFLALFTDEPKPIKWIDKSITRPQKANLRTLFELFLLLIEFKYIDKDIAFSLINGKVKLNYIIGEFFIDGVTELSFLNVHKGNEQNAPTQKTERHKLLKKIIYNL